MQIDRIILEWENLTSGEELIILGDEYNYHVDGNVMYLFKKGESCVLTLKIDDKNLICIANDVKVGEIC